MRSFRYIGEGASIKVLVFIVVYMFIFMNNRNRALEEFKEDNMKQIRLLEHEIDVMSGFIEASSDLSRHQYEEHFMHHEDHLALDNIVEELNIGISQIDENGVRVPITSLKKREDDPIQEEARIAYATLKYSRNVGGALGSSVWIYYYTHSGILSEYPRYNTYDDFSGFQKKIDKSEEYYSGRVPILDILPGEGGNAIVHTSIPVYYDGKTMGVLSGNIKPIFQRERGMEMYILDREGKAVFSTSPEEADRIKTLADSRKDTILKRRGGKYLLTSRLTGYDGLFCYSLPVMRVYYRAFKDSTILILIAFILYLSQRDVNRGRRTARERELLIAQLVEVRRNLEEMSEQDYLTKLLNRRGFLKRAEEEYSRLQRHGGVFSLILCDIDFFKKFNDNYGHECGDMVLKEVSEMFRKSIRESDLAGRWGGEEFIFLLIESEGYPAYQRAESLRRAVEEYIFKYRERELRITISFGVYQVNPDLSLEENINIADKALYLSKQRGRNRVEIIEDPPS